MKQKRNLQRLGLIFVAFGLLVQTATALITIETVSVGNAGNVADPTTGYGTVGYDYAIGMYEVTLNQYTEFLNAVAATDTYGLYNTQMGSSPRIMGISRTGVSGSYSYSVIGSENRPVTYVSWYDSARFVNWLHNGQPAGLQVAGTTETGAYTLTGNTGSPTRNSTWMYGLPSENEWYKAAYHQPFLQGGDFDDYWLYPMMGSSNAVPNSRNGSLSDPNSANFRRVDGITDGVNDGYAVTGSTTLLLNENHLTEVGAFSLASSFYGTFDQAGNVREWTDGIVASGGRAARGGDWNSFENILRASTRTTANPGGESEFFGFRVAVAVPEPSLFGLLGLGAFLALRKQQ